MSHPFRIALGRFLLWATCALALAGTAAAQSTDAGQPTPVFNGEVSGGIAPRDLGDARLTRHFYTFGAAEGDLTLTVESTDLNGDVDLFTASTLRPLLKITLYAAGSTPTRVTKSVYLRRDETIVLRVEGRTVIDTEARYRISLGGSFKPASGAPAQVTESQPIADPGTPAAGAKGRRTTSTGARIPETPAEAAARAETERAAAAAAAAAAEAEAATEPARPEAAREPARRREGRRTPSRSSARNNSRRTRPPATENTSPDAATTPAGENAEADRANEERASETPAAETPAPSRTRARPTRRGGTRRGERAAESRSNERAADEASAAAAPAAEPAAEPSTRLVIVTKDGESFARDMKGVRRVTVERGQIVVVGTDGKVTRHPMSNVTRMAIEP